MHISDILASTPTTFSFEFFPPKTPEGSEKLYATIRQLEVYRPSFVSVTYHPGGATRDLTHNLVVRIKRTTTLEAVPHLTCVCHNSNEIQDILQRYAEAGVSNILALGGDPPVSHPNYDRSGDHFRFAADLVKYTKDFNSSGGHPDPRGFGIGVAGFPEGHPATPNRLREMDHLKAKVEAGADYVCTQLFFDNHDFFDFQERCEIAGIKVPIIAGIMPLTSLKTMARMAELAAGARFPAKLLKAIERCGNDEEAIERVGIHYATEQCFDLLDHGVRGIHFYTLNRSAATREIYANLGIKDSRALRA